MTWAKTVFILGPAGSGKTSLTESFGRYLEEQGFQTCYVNLDAAVEEVPYDADFDIRTYYTVRDIMRREKIGPNMALIRSVEELLRYEDQIKKFVEYASENYDYILVDTPGQLELTLFYDASIKIMRIFSERTRACGVFLIPADIVHSVRDLAFLKLMALATRYRIDVPVVSAITKADLNPKIDEVLSIEDEKYGEIMLEGAQKDLVEELWKIISRLEKKQRVVKICIPRREGLDDLHTLIYEVFCTCGDLS